jgi:hypothetical protein
MLLPKCTGLASDTEAPNLDLKPADSVDPTLVKWPTETLLPTVTMPNLIAKSRDSSDRGRKPYQTY